MYIPVKIYIYSFFSCTTIRCKQLHLKINCSTGRIRDQHRLHANVINAHTRICH